MVRALRLEDPEAALSAVAALRRRLSALEQMHVRNAREEGLSWSQIGDLLGVSKQALHKKHAPALREAQPDPRLRARKGGARVVVTGAVRRAVRYAQEEARAHGHYPVGTGHFLLGALRNSGSPAARALERCGVTLSALREQVDSILEVLPAPVERSERVPVSRAAHRALEQSLHEAVRMNDGHLGVEHLVLGVLREERGAAAQALTALGTTAEAVEAELMAALARRGPEAGTSDPGTNVAA